MHRPKTADSLRDVDGYRNVVKVINHRGFKVYIQLFISPRFGNIYQIQNNIGEPWTDEPPAYNDLQRAIREGKKIVDEYVDEIQERKAGGIAMNRLEKIAKRMVAGDGSLGDLSDEINGLYKQYDEGKMEYDAAVELAIKSCKDFIKNSSKFLDKVMVNKWGFDLTDIKGSVFARILQSAGINPNTPDDTDRGWIWKGSGVIVVTANNPITGEAYKRRRETGMTGDAEKDYASYIGIEGDPEKVAAIAHAIKKYATAIKGETKGSRSYI